MEEKEISIWANFNMCMEIAPNVYYAIGTQGEGLVILKEYADGRFTPETEAAGQEEDGYMYFPSGKAMEMAMSELRLEQLAVEGQYDEQKEGADHDEQEEYVL